MLLPLIEQSRARLGGIADRTWGEPYMLGLVMTLVTLAAQHNARGRLSSEDLGLVQLRVWNRLTGLPDDAAGERLCRLSAGEDQMFEWGCARGLRLFELLQPGAAPRSGAGEPCDADAVLDVAEAWQRYFEERVIEIAAEAQ